MVLKYIILCSAQRVYILYGASIGRSNRCVFPDVFSYLSLILSGPIAILPKLDLVNGVLTVLVRGPLANFLVLSPIRGA